MTRIHFPEAAQQWPDRLHVQWEGVRADIGGWVTEEPSFSDLLAGEHVLLGTLDGGGRQVVVSAEGVADWRGSKLVGSAGFFPAGRRMRSFWPASRLTYLKLAIDPLATESFLERPCPEGAWRTRPSADDPFVSATVARLAQAITSEPADRLASLTAETLATALHLHLTSRFSDLWVRQDDAHESLRRVIDLIHSTLPQAVSLSEMVKTSRLPRARFLVAFSRTTGCSPHQYILRERLARARHLLETSTLTVGEVASSVGFSSPGHLTRHYRTRFDDTPLAWRKRHSRL